MTAAVSRPAFAVRPGTDADRNYILDSWRESERAAVAHTEGPYFTAMQNGTMRAILERPSTRVRVAYPYGSEETIAGWAVLRPPVMVLHKGSARLPDIGPVPVVYFCYVREDGRRLGLARTLLADVLARPRALVTSRPAHVRDAKGWHPSPVPVPKAWYFCPRAAHVEP